MNTKTAYQKLLDDKSYWEGVSNHSAEQASIDSQSNFTLCLAQNKLATIDRSLRRIARGAFGKCDTCGATIEPERLEALLDSDCHTCATCAKLQLDARRPQSLVSSRRDSSQQQFATAAFQTC